jgi:Na+-translocating ferredoxin:NAD+ oxidoreductase RnfD subunit
MADVYGRWRRRPPGPGSPHLPRLRPGSLAGHLGYVKRLGAGSVTEGAERSSEARTGGIRTRIDALVRRLPAARLLWILLAVLATYGVWFLGAGIGIATAIGLPALTVVVDLLFQRIRFDRFRFPDAAIATGLFLALLLPPVVPAIAAASAGIAAITLRHVLRRRGRPLLNPAASGVFVGAVLFGLAPAWWGAINETLVIVLGIVLLLWQRRSWRLPVVFLGAYAGLAVLQRVVFSLSTGLVLVPRVLFLSAVDPTVLFFGFFMVAEPRTAPSDPGTQPIYAIVVAACAAILPLFLPTISSLVGLLLGNLVTLGLRSATPSASASRWGRRRETASRPPAKSRLSDASVRWSVARRVTAGIAVFLLVGSLAAATSSSSTSGGSLLGSHPISHGGSAVDAGQCQNDNGTVAATTLQSLHKTLGPSVILSYSPSTNLVVFYDPVNAVTVTETDLYEDYGFAEFNGDDYTSAGCVPP